MKGPWGFLANLSGINVTARAGKMAAQSRSPGNKQQKGVRFFRYYNRLYRYSRLRSE